MNHKFLSVLCGWGVFILALACSPSRSNDLSCQNDSDCFQGEICINNTCLIRCTTDSDCPGGRICTGGACLVEADGGSSDAEGHPDASTDSDGGIDSDASADSEAGTEKVSPPRFSPAGGTYNEDLEVTITCDTELAGIYYSMASSDTRIYSGPIPVSGDGTVVTIRAMAAKEGYETSDEAVATYTIDYTKVAPPEFIPSQDTIYPDQSITITTNTSGAAIYYTLDGNEPTDASTEYTLPIYLTGSDNSLHPIKARAYKTEMKPSDTAEKDYTLVYYQVSAPAFNPVPGFHDLPLDVALSTTTPDASIYYTLDASDPTPAALHYTSAFGLLNLFNQSCWVKAIAVKSGMRDSEVSSGEYFLLKALKYWHEATSNGGFIGRKLHASIVYDNKMWVIGGFNSAGSDTNFNDVWWSANGSIWTQARYNGAPYGFPARYNHRSVVYDNKMWVIGGIYIGGMNYLKDVWWSVNGNVWTKARSSGDPNGFSERLRHTSVVYDNKIWVISGSYGGGYKNDVLWSENGTIWTLARYNGAPYGFPGRDSHTSLVFDNKMWVIGGSVNLNDVWWSVNGTVWTQARSNGDPYGFTIRSCHTSEVYDDKMWVIGGSFGSSYLNDVWWSENGTIWTQARYNGAPYGFPGRDCPTAAVHDNKMWVIGGFNGAKYFNDVWWSE